MAAMVLASGIHYFFRTTGPARPTLDRGARPFLQPVRHPPVPFLLAVLGALVGLWFLRTALAPFFLAGVLAYLMEPLSAAWPGAFPGAGRP